MNAPTEEARNLLKELFFKQHLKGTSSTVNMNPFCRIYENKETGGIAVPLVQQLCLMTMSPEQIISRIMKNVYFRDIDAVWFDLFMLNIMKNNPNHGWSRQLTTQDINRVKQMMVNVLLLRMLNDHIDSMTLVTEDMVIPWLNRGELVIIEEKSKDLLALSYKMIKRPILPKGVNRFSGIVTVHMPPAWLHPIISERLKEKKSLKVK